MSGGVIKEQPDRKFIKRFVEYDRIVETVEKETNQKWQEFGSRRGNEIRNLLLYLVRHRSGMTLREIGQKTRGLDYKMVGKAVKRCEVLIGKNRTMRRLAERCL